MRRWFDRHRRPMPWRDAPSPWRVWVSEVMLQQTRVETVEPYFLRFLERFPTPQALAEAPLEMVLRLWQGLGYYARARNLQRAAQSLRGDGYQLPRTAAQWRTLPGIGDYTAAAIASIAFQEPVPLVDGNVARLFIRVLALPASTRDTTARRHILSVLSPVVAAVSRPGDFNQAIMELGALICVPRHPRCTQCPMPPDCRAFAQGLQAHLPKRNSAPSRPDRYAVAARIRRNGRTLLRRREPDRLLGGLWALPGTPFDPTGESPEDVIKTSLAAETGITVMTARPLGTVRHEFSHFRLNVQVFAVQIRGRLVSNGPYRWVSDADLDDTPIARLDRKALALHPQGAHAGHTPSLGPAKMDRIPPSVLHAHELEGGNPLPPPKRHGGKSVLEPLDPENPHVPTHTTPRHQRTGAQSCSDRELGILNPT